MAVYAGSTPAHHLIMHKLIIYREKATGERKTKKFWVKGYRNKGGLNVKDEDYEGIIKLIADPRYEYLGRHYGD